MSRTTAVISGSTIREAAERAAAAAEAEYSELSRDLAASDELTRIRARRRAAAVIDRHREANLNLREIDLIETRAWDARRCGQQLEPLREYLAAVREQRASLVALLRAKAKVAVAFEACHAVGAYVDGLAANVDESTLDRFDRAIAGLAAQIERAEAAARAKQ